MKREIKKRLLPKRFYDDDIKRWQKVADKENRNLTNWMETELNKAADKSLGKLKTKQS